MVLRKEQSSEFPKFFFGGYLFVVVEYLCNRSPKIKTKNIKNYSSILAVVNHRKWLDDSPPLMLQTANKNEKGTRARELAYIYHHKKKEKNNGLESGVRERRWREKSVRKKKEQEGVGHHNMSTLNG